MSTRERWLATIAFWFALPSPCLAHRPYVEPWMHAASISLAAALGITTALLLRRKAGIVVAVGVGLVVSLLGSFAGWVASMVLSM